MQHPCTTYYNLPFAKISTNKLPTKRNYFIDEAQIQYFACFRKRSTLLVLSVFRQIGELK